MASRTGEGALQQQQHTVSKRESKAEVRERKDGARQQ